MLKIENLSGEVLQLHTRSFAIGEVWVVPVGEGRQWAANDDVVSALMGGSIRVLDGDSPIGGVAAQLDFMKSFDSLTSVQLAFEKLLPSQPSGSVIYRASSVLTDGEKTVTDVSPEWTMLGGTVTTPSFFTAYPEHCRGRVVGQYRSDGPVSIRLREDDIEPSSATELMSTEGEWTVMQWFTADFVSGPGTHTYTLEGQLGDGATTFQVRFVASSLLEFVP